MRIVFMGTPEFAVPSLEKVAEKWEVAAVITQPDRKRGRGQKYSFSPVKLWAKKHGLPILQPERLSLRESVESLRLIGADCFAVVAFGQIVPSQLLEMPPLGCINLHASLLPQLRGAAPINAAIIQGARLSGVTTMYMTEELDAGDIILQREVEIFPEDTAGSLHGRLMEEGALLLGETLQLVASGQAPRRPQDHGAATFAPKLSKGDTFLDFQKAADKLERRVRGLYPRPGACITFKNELIKVWQAQSLEQRGEAGRILKVDSRGLLIGCKTGSLLLEQLQRPGSKPVSGLDFANGLRLNAGDYLK